MHAEKVFLIGIEGSARNEGKQKHSSYPRHGPTERPLVAAQTQATHSQQIGHNRRRSHDQPNQVWLELGEEGGQREFGRQLLAGQKLGRGCANQLGGVHRRCRAAEAGSEPDGDSHDRQF